MHVVLYIIGLIVAGAGLKAATEFFNTAGPINMANIEHVVTLAAIPLCVVVAGILILAFGKVIELLASIRYELRKREYP